jgi:hypothetical protein
MNINKNQNLSQNQNQNQTQNKNNNTDSSIIDLEKLRQQYSKLLIQYKASIANYVTYLNERSKNANTNTDTNTNNTLIAVKGMAYVGTGSAGESTATTLQDCIASCSNSKTCAGATFIASKCTIRTGETTPIASSSDSYAILPKGKQLVLQMEQLNQQLLDINKQITKKNAELVPFYKKTTFVNDVKTQELVNNYNKLVEERQNIEEALNEYNTLDNAENEHQIKITQNYYYYILLVIAVIALIVLLYKYSSTSSSSSYAIQNGGDLGSTSYYITFGLIAAVIALNLFLSNIANE